MRGVEWPLLSTPGLCIGTANVPGKGTPLSAAHGQWWSPDLV